MPDQENLINRPGVALGLPTVPNIPLPRVGSGEPGTDYSINDYYLNKIATHKPKGAENIPLSSFYTGGNRYTETRPGTDYEEMAAQQQSAWAQWRNGISKTIGTAATSFASGTAGIVYGAFAAAGNQRWASLIDNSLTRGMDDLSNKFEDFAPNYYNHQQQDAEWYSPDNILTANFWSDKVTKNLGYSLGALGGGMVWGKAFRAIGLTNKLVQAGKGLETATAIEEAMSAVPNLQKYGAFENALNSMAQKYIKSPLASILVDSDRILTSTMGTFGEAAIEGYQNLNDFRQKAIREYRDRFGVDPTGKALEDINKSADKVGMYTWGMNTILLTGTNYIQLPKILSSSKSVERALINDIKQEALGGEWIQKVANTRFGKIVDGIRGVSRLAFSPIEAFEEGAQFSIQMGVNDYFKRAYDNKENVKSFLSTLNNVGGNIFGEGIEKTLSSKEGMESILIGGISGGLQQMRSNIKEGGVFGEGGEKQQNTLLAIDALNKTNIKKILQDQAKFLGIGIGSQELRQQAIVNNDKLSEKNFEHDYTLSYLMPRAKYGKIESVFNELAGYESQAMNEQGFEQLKINGIVNENETREQFLDRINTLRETAKSVDQLYTTVNDKYSGIYDENGEQVYGDGAIDRMVYAASKIRDYDKRVPSLNAQLVKSNVLAQQILDDVVKTGTLDVDAYNAAMASIDGMNTITSDERNDLKQDLQDLAELALERKQYIDEYDDIKNNPEKYSDIPYEDPDPIDENAPKEIIKIKTKKGDVNVETNTEYYLGRVTEYDKNGQPVYRMPKFTILADNGDGTIKIRDANGERNIEKSKLEDYNLGKVSDLEKDKKGKFFHENWNTIFKHKGLKDSKGKPYQGRLVYSPKNRTLLFEYVNEKGKVRSVEVTGDKFVAQKGYTSPMIEAVSKLTAVQQNSLNEYSSEKDELSKALQRRKGVVADLVKASQDRLEEVNKQLEKAKETITQIDEALKNAMFTKKGLPRKNVKAYKKTVDQLSKQKQAIEKTIDVLEDEREELEGQLPYIQSLLEYAETLPDNFKDAISDLKEDISSIEEMIENTNDSIKKGKSLIEKIDEALKEALSIFNDFVVRLKEENPGIPIFITDFQARIERFLGEEGAKDFINQKLGYTEVVLDLEEQISEFNEEMNIPNLEKRSQFLAKRIPELEAQLGELIEESIAKGKLLEAFETTVKQIEEERAQQELLQKSETFINSILGTHDLSQRNIEEEDGFEEDSKKTNLNVIKSGIPSQNLPGYANANQFGNNFYDFENKDQLKTVLITSTNEAEYGLEGLTKHLAQGKDELPEDDPNYIDPTQTIVMVMVEEGKDGVVRLVGVDGKALEETATFDNTVYQVMPSENLQWSEEYGNQSMFRKGTNDKIVESLKKQYKEWRDGIIANPPTTPFNIDASFGIPERVTVKNDEGKDVNDTAARVGVEDSGLVSEDELQNRSVIVVPTTSSTVERGTTKFKNALGMVFLKMKNGYVKLQNRKFSQKEATTIYQAIERVATKIFEDENAQGEETQRLLNWLKSVVYWGTPKNSKGERKKAGYNSIWFENVAEEGEEFSELKLFISNNEGSIPFTPQYLRDNKAEIIALIQKLYNNTNSTKAIGTKKISWNEPYEEILEVKADGTLVTRDWPNYQTFLLSSRMPDADGNLTLKRPADELPLVTQIRPKTSPSDVNRKSVYFILKDLKFTEPKLAPAPAPITKIVPGKGSSGVSTGKKLEEAPEGSIDLSGKRINTYVSPIKVVDGKQTGGKKIKWVYDPNKSGIMAITVLGGGDILEILDIVKEQVKKDSPDATDEEIAKTAQTKIKTILLQSIPPGALEEFEEGGIIIGEDDDDLGIVIDEESSVEEEDDDLPSIYEDETGGIVIGDNDDDSNIEDDMRDMDIPHDLRVQVEEDIDQYESENWDKIEKWLKANFPNLPVYRVKNILKATNGLQAWGMLKKGALYIYENAEVGTIYHEVFEGVIKHFASPREVRAILKEFRSRKGTFIDRPTGREIEYNNATYAQAKEQLAEEFRDYVQEGKIPPKPVDKRPLVVRLFADIVNAVKNFFLNTPNATNNTERLFEKIGTGYYKTHAPYAAKLSFAEKGIIDIDNALIDGDSDLRLKLRGDTVNDIMQHMTYMTLRSIMGNNESLFTLERIPKKDLYRKLKHNIGQTILLRARVYKENELLSKEERKLPTNQKTKLIRQRKAEMRKKGDLTYSSKIGQGIDLWKTTMRQWENIVAKHEEYLKAYNIEFDENDDAYMKSEENTGRGEYDGADKIDHFRKTNSAIKLLLSTLPMMQDGKTQFTSINGIKLMPLSKVYMSLMNNLHTSRSLDEMIERVREMALADENYRLLYSRLTGTDYTTNTVNLEDIEDMHDLQLLSAFWKTFKKQSPDVRSIFIFENGDITMSDSNFSSAARQVQQEYENAMKIKFRSKNKYFEFNKEKRSYVGKADAITQIDLDSNEAKVKFLNELGIEFTNDEVNNLSFDKKKTFDDAVSGIRKSISEAAVLGSISGKVLSIEGRLLSLGLIRAQIANPEFDSTFFNVSGERTQTFIGTNPISDMFDAIHQVNNITELAGTQYEYLLTDDFAQNSVILNRMFDIKRDANGTIISGKRREDILNYLKGAYADGTVDLDSGKRKQSSKLTYKQRLVQEINMNLNGYYSNLVPGDASMEHMAFMGNAITSSSLMSGFKRTFDIFKGYFISEVMLSKSDRSIVGLKGRNAKDLRFFKGILGETLHDKIVNDKRNLSPDQLYKAYENQINKAVEEFIKKESENTKNILFNYGILDYDSEGGLMVNGIDFEGRATLNEASLNRQLNALSINYIINNIELHKLLYSDPYQYSDELKRIKNFLSPRQPLLNSSASMNAAMNKVFNKGYEEITEDGKRDVAYTDMDRDFFRTVVFEDVLAEHELPGYEGAMYKETDGAGIILDKANRNMRFRSGEWNTDEERQFRYDMAWYKDHKGLRMSDEEKNLLEKGNPSVRSTYTTKKPIVSGNKADGKSYNDVVLDKFALYPLSYRVMYASAPRDEKGNVIETNAMKLYDKMMAEDIDYAVFETGRKVGTTKAYDVYNSDGSFNDTPYDTVNNIPFSIFSIQSEVPSKEDGDVTRGTQPTKLMTLDFMEAGVPIDFMTDEKNFDKRYAKWIALKTEAERETNSELYKEIKNNQMLLEAMIDNGYYSLLKRMGISETITKGKKSFQITDLSKAAQTLRDEVLKRETNDNISEALAGFLNGDAVLEATPAYQQIRNILYSIADREVVSQKITGGQKIQIPSVFMETNRISPKIIEDEKGVKRKVYTSDALDFYEKDGKQVCEIMISRWFDSPLSDEALLKYLNTTAEGQRILAGLAFRIPSQKQNSIESFVVKRFLPREFGDNVVVPGPLVQKAGSDFDIDKLFMYLKNVFVGKDGKPRLIEFLTDKNSTTEERYVHWVRDNANRDTKKYIKFLTRQAIQNLRTNFNIEFAKVQAQYQNRRAEGIEDLYSDMVKDIEKTVSSKTTDQEEYLEELFRVGHRVFFAMDDITRDPFWILKSEISRRGIKGPDEIRRYLALAISMTQDSSTIEEDMLHLENLIRIYNEELRVMGIKQEVIDNIRKEAVEGFRKDKDVLKYALKLDVTKGFDTLSDLYEEAKDRENFIAAQEVASIDELPSFDEFRTRSIYDQNTRKALQNGYIQSSQNLVSHPANFDQLIKPNSAQQAKDLAKDITKKRGLESFDYSSTSNMLSRGFMTRLRHAFVSGRYAIGIAAVNQTNHSLNQRQPIYINDDMLEFVSDEDRMWLGDAKINFKDYNSMKINGKTVPTLSMIKNKAGEYISDLIGQFIDGYVDISKGPWIMELGATPNVASTWLFLIKLGVPLKTVAYFMNQPIVRDYLMTIENAGYSWLFIDSFYDSMIDGYGGLKKNVDTIPSEKLLGDMIGKTPSQLTPQQKEQQTFILKEFVKYARMANQMFLVTQGSNFDTATFNDPYLVFKKLEQYKLAQNTIISSVDDLVKNSFLRKLSTTIGDIRNAYAEILQSDRNNIRDVIEPILRPYINLSDRDFVKIAQKAVSDLFDWAVQTDRGFNKAISKILLSDESAAKEVATFIESVKKNPKHALHNNEVIKSLVYSVENEVNNLSLKNRDNKVYDQNQIIYGFAEIREHLEGINNKKLYEKLVLQAFLQSGLSNSKIAFTSLLPYEDFKEVYNKTLSKLNNLSNLQQFRELAVFERNNWNNEDIVPKSKAVWIQVPDYEYGKRWQYNPSMAFLPNTVKDGINNGEIPQAVSISSTLAESHGDYIVYSWEKDEDELLTEKEMKLSYSKRRALVKEKKLDMRKRGDYSYMKKGLFKRVYDGTLPYVNDYTTSKGELRQYHIYSMINAWGDSYRANEFYDVARPSVIDNNFLKVKQEAEDSKVVELFEADKVTKAAKKAKRIGSTVTKTIKEADVTVTGDAVAIKAQIDNLEATMKEKGLGPKDMATLKKLQTELGKIIKSQC